MSVRKFILEVLKYPVLYDKENPNFNKLIMKNAAWMEISETLHIYGK